MNPITIHISVSAPIAKVWECWTKPEHINGWAFASDDWQAEAKTNDLKVGGEFLTYMSAKDGSGGFDFGGNYTAVEEGKHLAYTLGDGRKVIVDFNEADQGVDITQTFDPESENDPEFQRQGWQAFLDNFKKYTESH